MATTPDTPGLLARLNPFHTPADNDPSGIPIPADDVWQALKNSRRRHCIAYLAQPEIGDAVEIRELAEYIACIENNCPAESLDSQDRKRVWVSLYQCHLPELDDSGIVEFDKARAHGNSGRVYATPALPELDALRTDIETRIHGGDGQ